MAFQSSFPFQLRGERRVVFQLIVAFAIIAGAISLLFPSRIFAQETKQADLPKDAKKIPIVKIATVNIFNAYISKQEEGVLEVTYDIHNREGVQPDIVSLVSLTDSDGSLAQQYRSSSIFSLGIDEQRTRTIQMDIFPYLSGEFEVVLNVATQSGVSLATVSAGKVLLSGSGEYIKIRGCVLSVSGEGDKTYNSVQGVDIVPGEQLIATCNIQNLSSKKITATPHLKEHWRSLFGNETAQYSVEPIVVEPNAEMKIIVPIQQNSKPQSYTQTLSLIGENGEPVSIQTDIHYVVRGEGATIQNIVFDKPSYNKGESAKISFGFTGSADNFLGARAKENTAVEGVAILEMTDGKSACAQKQEVTFNASESVGYIYKEITVPVERECINPTLGLTVKNMLGEVLDNRLVSSNQERQPARADESSLFESAYSRIVLGFVILLCAVLLILLFVKLRRRRSSSFFAIFSLCLISGIFGFTVKKAYADTFVFDITSDKSNPYTVTVNHNKSVYLPGEEAVITSSINTITCLNGWGSWTGYLDLRVPESKRVNTWDMNSLFAGLNADLISGRLKKLPANCVEVGLLSGHMHYACTTFGSSSFTVQTTPGSYNANYRLTMDVGKGFRLTGYGDFDIPYRVEAPQPVAQPAIGNFERTDSTTCSVGGWAFDPDGASQSINVHIYRDGQAGNGTFVSSCSANVYRSDVNSVHGITGNHGFSCALPSSYIGTGAHNLYIHAIDINGTPNNLISGNPKSLNCVPQPPSPPSFPSIFSFCSGSSPQVSLSWGGAPGFNSSTDIYQIFRCIGSGCTANATNLVGSTTLTSWTDSSVANNTFYRYAVRVRISGVWSSLSSYVSAITPDCSVPTPTLNLYPSSLSITKGGSVSFTWTATNTGSLVANSCQQTATPTNSQWALTGQPVTNSTPQPVTNLGQTTTFTLTCNKTAAAGGGFVAANATVTVNAASVPTGTINATSCSIPLNESSCPSTVSWTSANFVGAPSVRQSGTQFSSMASSSGMSRSITFGPNQFILADTGSAYSVSTNATGSCASGSWNGSMCSNSCACDSTENAQHCPPRYTNICGASCLGTKNCKKPWIEVSP